MTRPVAHADVTVHAATPADQPALADFFAGLSAGTCYFRFGCVAPGAQADELASRCNCNPAEMEHLLAFASECGARRIIGSMQCLICAGHGEAEFELVVADDWQGLGVGHALMEVLLARLRARSLATLRARILATNQRMIEWVGTLGFEVSLPRAQPGLVEARLNLATLCVPRVSESWPSPRSREP